ncbi:hypothetical protein J6590_065524 [Homalodisca vitripennis]|nr:hypothetical protein J6590_065524 [Homalodisca vitripennis]
MISRFCTRELCKPQVTRRNVYKLDENRINYMVRYLINMTVGHDKSWLVVACQAPLPLLPPPPSPPQATGRPITHSA